MRAPLIAALVLLVGCGTRQPAPPAEPETAESAACRTESRDNPERRRLMRQRFDANAPEIDTQIAAANQAAFLDCMRRRGVVQGGGVERVRR